MEKVQPEDQIMKSMCFGFAKHKQEKKSYISSSRDDSLWLLFVLNQLLRNMKLTIPNKKGAGFMIWNTPEWTRPGGFKHTVREPQTAHQMGHLAKCKRKVFFNCIFISFTAFLLTK